MYSLLHGGKDKSSINLFIENTNDPILRISVLNEVTTCFNSVTTSVMCYRTPVEIYKAAVLNANHLVQYCDCFTDPFNWFTNDGVQTISLTDVGEINQFPPTSDKEHKEDKPIIFIDDLLLFGRSHKYVDNFGQWCGLIKFLHKLSTRYNIFAFINPDLVSDGNLRSVMHLSPFHVTIDFNSNLRDVYHCNSMLRKPSGKITTNNINIKIDNDAKVVAIKEEESKQIPEESNDPDPTSNLTFNLRLTDKEKEARANTALPYLLNESSKSAYLGNSSCVHAVGSSGGGEVIYLPDDADDFDDEDPDDDLDF